jgi:hypothetical protein
MAFTVPVENYVRSPYPSLPESKERYLQEELKKLERTLGTVSGALGEVEGFTAPPAVPAFSAYQSVAVSFSPVVLTKVLFQTEEFDTDGAYDTSTSRFSPTVPGYYSITAAMGFPASAALQLMVYKNGAENKRGTDSASSMLGANVACLIFLNGFSDYLEIYGRQSSASAMNSVANADQTYFQGVLVKAV